MTHLRRILLLSVAAMILAGATGESLRAGSSAPAAEELKKVRLMVAWFPQSQFAGYYLAVDAGIYQKHGLAVEIIPGGPDRDQGEFLRDDQTDYAVSWLAPAMVNRDHGIPVVLTGQIMHRSNLAFVGWKEKGVRGLGDLQGRRVSLFEGWSRPALYAFLLGQKLGVKTVPQYFTMDLFLRRGVDVASVMTYNEYFMLYLAGVDESELSLIRLSDHGFVFPEDGLYTLESRLAADPDTARRLLQASREGWELARAKPDLALASVMRRVREKHMPTNVTHMRLMLHEILGSIFPPEFPLDQWGKLPRADFERCARQMLEAGLVGKLPDYEKMTAPEVRHAP